VDYGGTLLLDYLFILCKFVKNKVLKFLSLGVLVGAFSDFGGLDTDNPVQILRILGYFEAFRFPEGLI